MKFFRIILILLIISNLSNSCSDKDKNKKINTVTLRQEWFPNSNYAGELIASHDFAKEENINLKIEAGSDNIDPLKLVLSGKDDFGVAGADKVMLANANGANLVVIGVLNYNSPTCFLTLSNNIKTPSDFIGKKVGVLTGTATEYVYRALISKENIDKAKLTEIEAPFDIATFISGAYDVRPAFIYDEPISLDMKNIKYNIIRPEDYGVNFIGTVYFTTEKMVKENPKIVQSFVNIIAKGWLKAFENPDLAIKYLKAYDKDINIKRERASLLKALPYFKNPDGKILLADRPHWEAMSQEMKKLGLISDVNLSNLINESFCDNFYKNYEK